jgi:hypothetical protein
VPGRRLHGYAALGLVDALEGFLYCGSPGGRGERFLKRGAGLGTKFLGARDLQAFAVDLRVSSGLARRWTGNAPRTVTFMRLNIRLWDFTGNGETAKECNQDGTYYP